MSCFSAWGEAAKPSDPHQGSAPQPLTPGEAAAVRTRSSVKVNKINNFYPKRLIAYTQKKNSSLRFHVELAEFY